MDDLADLMWKDGPQKTKVQPKTLGSTMGSSSGAIPPTSRGSSFDSFSMLASASSRPQYVQPTSKPSSTHVPTPSRSPAPPTSSTPGPDAFGGLLSLGGTNNANMSIAERQARIEKERLEKERKQKAEFQSQGAFWDKFESGPSNTPRHSAVSPAQAGRGSTFLLSPSVILPTSRPSSAANTLSNRPASRNAEPDLDVWGEFDSLSISNPPIAVSYLSSRTASPSEPDPFDFATFDDHSPTALNQRTSPIPTTSITRSSTPGDFDFGDREDGAGLLDDADSGDEDILGDLARPVGSASHTRSPSPRSLSPSLTHTNGRAKPAPSRIDSPPPHIIGQIVEMGFAPQQARIALAATETGIDVQAALESLLQANAQEEPPAPRLPRRPDARETADESRPRRRARPTRESILRGGERETSAETSSSPIPAPLLDQADKVLAQASEIGLTMFNRANTFWSTGKAQLQKAYEERMAASAGSSNGGTRTGERPRWATDDIHHSEDERHAPPSSFRDEDDEENHHNGQNTARPSRVNHEPVRQVSQPQAPSIKSLKQSLFADQEDKPYVSPSRRRPAQFTPSGSQTQAPASRAPPRSRPVTPPPPLRKRSLVSAPNSVLNSSKTHRSKGTEMYKLGRFAEAEASYTTAIDSLPSGHLALVPLFNNRATARIKNGNHTGAISDASTVIDIIGVDYHPAKEEPLPAEVEVNLGDALVKALQKRAEALESAEKWSKAKDDWEKLTVIDWPAGARVRDEALRGAGRCRKMLSADGSTGETSTQAQRRPQPPKPKPKSKPATLSRLSPPSEALSRLRTATDTQDAEDLERIQLKDSVDARLLAWKGGKENNLRALIASLDTVLWPELNWEKVGMGQLITPSQVKIRYMKAIGRVHPDKLSTATLEHRMIANGVFGTLNEAWNTFKP